MATDVSPSTTDGPDETRESFRPDFTHLLAEFDCQDELLKPIKNSARIKYSSLDVSKQYIALGASTGSVYIFQRDSLKYILQLSSGDGSITKLLFARNSDRLAVVTWDGLIVVWELNIEQRKAPVKILTSTTHKNSEIGCLAWDESGNRVFAGDSRGWVTITNVDSKKPSGLFKLLSEVILKADSRIVQLDFFKNDLLVSTLTRCHVCLTKRKKCATIGKKLREGFFGACFWRTSSSQDVVVLSARPGSRIWEANINGEVLKTHQFKKLLALPPLPVVSLKSDVHSTFAVDGPSAAQSLTFTKLLPIGERFILALATSGIYVLNLENLQVVLWTDSVKDITMMALFGRDIYCLHSDQKICKYTLVGVARCAAKLFRRDRLEESLQVCITFQSCIKQQRSRGQLPVHTMRGMLQRLEETGKEEDSVKTFREMLSDIETTQGDTVSMASSHGSSDSGDIVRLESGIHLIRRRNDSENSEDDQFRPSRSVTEEESFTSLYVPSESDCYENADGKQGMASATVQEVEIQRSPKVIKDDEGACNKLERRDDSFDSVMLNLKNQSSQDADFTVDQTELDSPGQTMQDISSRDTTSIFTVANHLTDGNHPTKDSSGGCVENNATLSNENQSREILDEITATRQTNPGVENIEQSTKDGYHQSGHEPGRHDDDACNYMDSHYPWSNSTNVSTTHRMDNLHENSGESLPETIKQDRTESYESEENTMLQDVTDVTPLVVTSSNPEDGSPLTRQISENVYHIKQYSEEVMFVETVTNSKDADIKLIPNMTPSQHESAMNEDEQTTVHNSLVRDGVSLMKNEVDGDLNMTEDGSSPVSVSNDKVVYIRSDSGNGKEEAGLSNCKETAAESIRDLTPAQQEKDGNDKDEGITDGAWSAGDRVSTGEGCAVRDVKVIAETDREQNGSCDVSFPEFLQLPEQTAVQDALVYSPVKEQNILLSKLEDTKAVILKEKKKKLKKSKREPRIVEIGTVKSLPTYPSSPISRSPFPPASPSKTPVATMAMSPQVSSPGSKNSTKEYFGSSPGTLSGQSVSESPKDGVANGEQGNRNIPTAPDISLAKMGHSFKTVTRSLSQKLNKISPNKTSQSSDVPSPHSSSPREQTPPETVMNFEATQKKILEEATEMARLQLNDTSVCLDSGTTTATLKIWMKVLEGVLQNVVENHLRNGEQVDEKSRIGEQLKSPSGSPRFGQRADSPSVTLEAIRSLQMSDDLFSDCCQFVWNCFECEAFRAGGNNSPHSDKSHDAENSDVFHKENETVLGSVRDDNGSVSNGIDASDPRHGDGMERRWDNFELTNEPPRQNSWNSDIYHMDKPHKIQSAVTLSNYCQDFSSPDQTTPHGVTTAIQQERDRLASRFVWHLYPFLDPLKIRDAIDKWVIREETFQHLLEAEEATSEDQIWLKIQTLHQDTFENVVREVKDDLRESPVLAMACLNRIKAFAVEGTDMSSILHQCYPYVRFWEAIHLLKDAENYQDQIMSFVAMVANAFHEGSRTSFFLNELKNVSLRGFLLSIGLAQNPPLRSKLECAVCKVEPVPLSNRLWLRHGIVDCILDISSPDENLQDMLNLCYKHGHWAGVVKLHKVKGQRKAALKMMLKLADPRLLHETAGIYPQSFVEWHQVLTYLQSFLPVLPVSSLKSDRLRDLCVDCRRKSSERLDDLTSGPSVDGGSCDPMDVHSNLLQGEYDTNEHREVEVQSGDLSHDTLCSVDISDGDRSTSRSQESDRDKNTACCDQTFEGELEVSGFQMSSSRSPEEPSDGLKMGHRPDLKVKDEMSFSWEYVAGLLLESVGPDHALKVLQAYPIPNGALSAEFFRKCLRKASIDAKERTSKGKESEGTWEEERSAVHPLIRECLAAEMTHMPSVSAETESWFTVHSQQLHKMHWGRKINLNSDCQMCGWSLQSFTSNLYVYPCGHLYHKDCTSSQDSCIVCSSERLSESR